jgi:hypothetical protein
VGIFLSAPDKRHGVGYGRALRVRTSDPLGPEFCAGPTARRKQGHSGLGIELRKNTFQDADTVQVVGRQRAQAH